MALIRVSELFEATQSVHTPLWTKRCVASVMSDSKRRAALRGGGISDKLSNAFGICVAARKKLGAKADDREAEMEKDTEKTSQRLQAYERWLSMAKGERAAKRKASEVKPVEKGKKAA